MYKDFLSDFGAYCLGHVVGNAIYDTAKRKMQERKTKKTETKEQDILIDEDGYCIVEDKGFEEEHKQFTNSSQRQWGSVTTKWMQEHGKA